MFLSVHTLWMPPIDTHVSPCRFLLEYCIFLCDSLYLTCAFLPFYSHVLNSPRPRNFYQRILINRKHSNRTFELSNFGSLTQESELSGGFWPQGHEILVRLSESSTYPVYDLSEAFWLG